LIVLERAPSKKGGGAMWRCRYHCDKEIIASGSDLRSGNAQSCGCCSHRRRTAAGALATDDKRRPKMTQRSLNRPPGDAIEMKAKRSTIPAADT
jgi:hypothetical protein